MVLGHDGLGFVRLRRPMREGRRAGGLFRFPQPGLALAHGFEEGVLCLVGRLSGRAGGAGRRDNVYQMAARITLKAINRELARTGATARLARGGGYFYFQFGEAATWLDRTVQVKRVSDLGLNQWIGEYRRLKKLNSEIMRGRPRRPQSPNLIVIAVARGGHPSSCSSAILDAPSDTALAERMERDVSRWNENKPVGRRRTASESGDSGCGTPIWHVVE